jgi:prepilin-type N-terminal cleavage/methylation domain-containing protein
MARKKAFSILELLVVVGIVGVLVSILLPAVGKARASAARVACMSNLRQLVQAQMMYVAESGGYLTYPNWGDDRGSTGTWRYGWLYEADVHAAA